jgi:hypothetical protein
MGKFELEKYKELLARNNASPELRDFELIIVTQVFYNRRKSYFALIQSYVNNKTNANVLQGAFLGMIDEDLKKSEIILKDFERLSNFWIDLELNEFSFLFDNIHKACIINFGDEDPETEKIFRDLIEEFFFRIIQYSDWE